MIIPEKYHLNVCAKQVYQITLSYKVEIKTLPSIFRDKSDI